MTETFEKWMLDRFTIEELRDIATHGADAGWGDLTYYKDTVPLYKEYREEIWEMLMEDTESMGHDNPYQLIATFNRAKDVGNYTHHANLLVWYAAERIAQRETNREGGQSE